MLDGLFPEGVITAFGDPLAPAKPLFPEEEALVARAVEKRRLEFAKGRECARSALASFGLGDAPLLAGETREPLWPADVVGSITHTRGLCAAAVARSARYRGIGIDAEPAEPLDDDLARRVCAEEEAALSSSGLERGIVFRLVFSAKEAVYKCVFPITRRYLGFDDVHVRLTGDAFRAFLRVDSAPFRRGDEFEGRWRRIDEPAGARTPALAHLVTAAWIARDRALP